MPKMKTKSGAKKRFKVTATGRIVTAQAGKRQRRRTPPVLQTLFGVCAAIWAGGRRLWGLPSRQGVPLGRRANKAEFLRRQHQKLAGGSERLGDVLARLHVEQRQQCSDRGRIAVLEHVGQLIDLLRAQGEHTGGAGKRAVSIAR